MASRQNSRRFAGCACTLSLLVGSLADGDAAQGIAAPLMVTVPAGRFVMGRDDGPLDERHAHEVVLSTFQIDRLPVTNAEFANFLQATGWMHTTGPRLYDHDDSDARIHRIGGHWVADKGYERHPVVEANWVGARDYCLHLGKRLPTEAEWEKAARGTDARRYPWGSAPADATRAQFGAAFNATVPVGNTPAGASPYRALDLAGNVWEWVSSAYRPYPYDAADGREDPTPGPERVTRGGGHDSPATEITATQRGRNLSRNPAAGHHNIGFRCALSAAAPASPRARPLTSRGRG
jgi:iron(II)-dependent oxidoreductase